MLSGIKYLFGYSSAVEEPDAAPAATSEGPSDATSVTGSDAAAVSHSIDIAASIGNLSTRSLEQTLSAATSKLTEQLLPPSRSIEQLQSSSHQMLPSINEQNVKQAKELAEDNSSGDEADDECFIADSWEMLDLVENTDGNSSLTIECKKSSGILKQTTTERRSAVKLAKNEKTIDPQEQRGLGHPSLVKLKVSFDETSDLVRVEEDDDDFEDEAPISTKQSSRPSEAKCKSSGGSKRTLSGEKSKSKKLKWKNRSFAREPPSKAASKKQNGSNEEFPPLESGETQPTSSSKSDDEKAPQSQPSKAKNSMSFATVAATKTDAENSPSSSSGKLATQSGKAKLYRPVSSSSCSSGDEIEPVYSTWKNDQGSGVSKVSLVGAKSDAGSMDPSTSSNAKERWFLGKNQDDGLFDNEDAASVASSSFSDCEFGYASVKDYYLRPKKGRDKYRSGASNSSSLLRSVGQSTLKRNAADKQTIPVADSAMLQRDAKQSSSRPKKKKLILAAPSPGIVCSQKRQLASKSSRGSVPQPPPVPPTTPAAALSATAGKVNCMSSGSESSDVADMDESWYVTPPPCFTGAQKVRFGVKPKAKNSALENELIEHPSLYLASTSQRDTVAGASKESRIAKTGPSQQVVAGEKEAPATIVTSKPARTVSKSETAKTTVLKKAKRKRSTTAVDAVPCNQAEAKVWVNKFVLGSLENMEQGDMDDDFDNMFKTEPRSTKKSVGKKASSAKVSKPVQQPTVDFSIDGDSEESDGDDWIRSPALVGVTEQPSSATSEENLSTEVVVTNDENCVVEAPSESMMPCNKSVSVEKRLPIPVKPIEPERPPAWQLRRSMRMRKRNLANLQMVNASAERRINKMVAKGNRSIGLSSDCSSSSACTSPSLINRIGSSIVANLTNLTSGFPSSPSSGSIAPAQNRAANEEVEKAHRSNIEKSISGSSLAARRRFSKSYMSRQNNCAKHGNRNQRADRRLKMYSTPNGCSINRKVQTNFR